MANDRAEYEKWHINNEFVPRVLPFPVWQRKMAALEGINARLRGMDPDTFLAEELERECDRLCGELGL